MRMMREAEANMRVWEEGDLEKEKERDFLLQTGRRDLITVKDGTLIGGIKIFYKSSCAKL